MSRADKRCSPCKHGLRASGGCQGLTLSALEGSKEGVGEVGNTVYDDYAPGIQTRKAEALRLERRLSDLVNQAYGLTPEEIDLMWKTAPPRMPFTPESSGSLSKLAAAAPALKPQVPCQNDCRFAF